MRYALLRPKGTTKFRERTNVLRRRVGYIPGVFLPYCFRSGLWSASTGSNRMEARLFVPPSNHGGLFVPTERRGDMMDPQHLIVLQGPGSVGKTLRLNLLINTLAKKYPSIPIPAGKGYLPDRQLRNNELAQDHMAAFLVNGKTEVVATGGDNAAAIQTNMSLFMQLSATVGVTSVRLRSDSTSCVELTRLIEEHQLTDTQYVRAYRVADASAYASVAENGARELYNLVISLCR